MSNANSPYVAKNAAPLVNPTVATVFSARDTNRPQFSAYVGYQVFNTLTSTTSQVAPNLSGHADNVNAAYFGVKAWGRATGGTTTNWTPSLLFGNSSTYASNTLIGTLTAGAFNSASGLWTLEAKIGWDATSGQISGIFYGWNGATAAQIANTLITPITGQQAASTLFFSISGLFSATNANNIAYLDGFEVEAI